MGGVVEQGGEQGRQRQCMQGGGREAAACWPGRRDRLRSATDCPALPRSEHAAEGGTNPAAGQHRFQPSRARVLAHLARQLRQALLLFLLLPLQGRRQLLLRHGWVACLVAAAGQSLGNPRPLGRRARDVGCTQGGLICRLGHAPPPSTCMGGCKRARACRRACCSLITLIYYPGELSGHTGDASLPGPRVCC